jgi:hypothetical protein
MLSTSSQLEVDSISIDQVKCGLNAREIFPALASRNSLSVAEYTERLHGEFLDAYAKTPSSPKRTKS